MAGAARPNLTLADEPTVLVAEHKALFRGFVETDPATIELLGVADDAEVAAHRLLALGARAATYVATTTQADAIQGRLEAMTATVETAVDGTLTELREATTGLLDAEDGELVRVLTGFAGDLGGMLDPARRDSVAAALATELKAVMDKALDAHARQVRRLVDPDAEDGPVGRVVRLVRDHTDLLGGEVRRLAEHVAADRARAEGLDRSGLKGHPYEEVLFNVVAELAAVAGDAAEHVGRDKGAAGTLKGDIVVHVNPADTCGRAARYALEAKTGRNRLRAILEELDGVLANRETTAAIAVFADTDAAPTKVPLQPYDNRALVVFDRSDLDDRALRLACLWARWVVRRTGTDPAGGPDLERMAAAIDRARRALERAATIRRAHSTATKGIGEARAQVDELVAEVDGALRTLTDELGE